MPPSYVPVETSSKVAAGPLASGDPQVTLSHVECLPKALALDPAGVHLSLFTSRSTRVALCDPRGVSTVPHTISSPEHRTISLRASKESQATKRSRMWQPPRVTSTISLQHEHLLPLDAITQCNALESLTHTFG